MDGKVKKKPKKNPDQVNKQNSTAVSMSMHLWHFIYFIHGLVYIIIYVCMNEFVTILLNKLLFNVTTLTLSSALPVVWGWKRGRGSACCHWCSSQTNMAAPMELLCWGGDWDLPSVHAESLIVLVTHLISMKSGVCFCYIAVNDNAFWVLFWEILSRSLIS